MLLDLGINPEAAFQKRDVLVTETPGDGWAIARRDGVSRGRGRAASVVLALRYCGHRLVPEPAQEGSEIHQSGISARGVRDIIG
jgi:hypothetical protein